jgi:hypothetical protein
LDTLVWRPGWKEWRKIADVMEIRTQILAVLAEQRRTVPPPLPSSNAFQSASVSAKSASAVTAAAGHGNISLHSKINSWVALLFLLAVFKVLSDVLSRLAAKWLQINNFEAANVAFVGGTAGVIAAFVVAFALGRFLAEIIPLWPPLSGILRTRGAAEITRGERIFITAALLVLAPVVLVTGGIIAEKLKPHSMAGVEIVPGTKRDILIDRSPQPLAAEETSSAVAEWISVAIADEPPSFIVYANRATIRRSGNLVKIWEIENYTAPQVITTGVSFLSSKAQAEYDCTEERLRYLFQAQFSEAMGTGNVVSRRSDPTGWSPVVPGSIGEITWKFACGKR